MLDALLTEARLRFGLDPAAGLQVIASEHLVATPLEPSRPALLVARFQALRGALAISTMPRLAATVGLTAKRMTPSMSS